MKAVILAGGFGTRISEESHLKPKPMIEIGGKPILWHILKIYSAHGINDFVICCGYKGYVIKEYFANYFLHSSDISFDMAENKMEVLQNNVEPWKITLIDTGLETMTGGRLKRVRDYVDDTFCMTYGDGVSDVDLTELIRSHNESGLICTMTAVQPGGRFGAIGIEDGLVTSFKEKPKGDGAWISGGFFVLNSSIFDYLEGDQTIFEKYPLEQLANERQLRVYHHRGFWQPMDTLRDKQLLESYWNSGNIPWKIW